MEPLTATYFSPPARSFFLGRPTGSGRRRRDRGGQFTEERVAAERPAAVGGQAQGRDRFGVLIAAEGGRPIHALGQLRPVGQVQQAGRVGGLAAVGGGAGPGVVHGPADQLGPHRVAFDVLHGPPEVLPVQSTGVEAVLPQVPAAGMKAVDVLGVAEVRPPESLGQRLVQAGQDHQVDVVAHQAPGQDLQPIRAAFLGQHAEIGPAVVVDEEDILTVIASLRDVMPAARNDQPGSSRHAATLRQRHGPVKPKTDDCPLLFGRKVHNGCTTVRRATMLVET